LRVYSRPINHATAVIVALNTMMSHTNCRRGSSKIRKPTNTESVESRSPRR
jgi:hypothetical protein